MKGICELTFETRDIPALEGFDTRVFVLDVETREDHCTWLAAGERARLGLPSPGEQELGDRGGRHGPVEHDGGDRSLYVDDPDGNVVEAWDFFERGRDVDGLADG